MGVTIEDIQRKRQENEKMAPRGEQSTPEVGQMGLRVLGVAESEFEVEGSQKPPPAPAQSAQPGPAQSAPAARAVRAGSRNIARKWSYGESTHRQISLH